MKKAVPRLKRTAPIQNPKSRNLELMFERRSAQLKESVERMSALQSIPLESRSVKEKRAINTLSSKIKHLEDDLRAMQAVRRR